MPDREGHLLQAGRFEAFLNRINTDDQPYKEWVVIVWFHIALHYVDAVLATKGHAQVDGHSARWALMANHPETTPIVDLFRRLYKEAKQARYEGTAFTAHDLAAVRPLYVGIRDAMRTALGMSSTSFR